MSIDKFLASVRSEGLMRTARFEVIMPVPNLFDLKNITVTDSKKILLYCDAVNLPGLSLSTTQSRTFGEFREMPWEKMFENINLSFYVDNGMTVKMFFDNWISNIQDPVTRNFAYYKDYTIDMEIHVKDVQDKTKYIVTLYECYPKAVASINMDMASKDVAKVQVSMNYKYWISNLAEGVTADAEYLDQEQSTPVPNQYFTDFNAFQAGLTQFGNINISPDTVENFDLGIGKLIT